MADQTLSPSGARPKTEIRGNTGSPNARSSTRVFPAATNILRHSYTTYANWLSSADLKLYGSTRIQFPAQNPNVLVSTSF